MTSAFLRHWRRKRRASIALEALRPAPPTCSACSSARWQSATANDSVLFCCTPAFTDSRLFMLSNIWACCSAMVLGEETAGAPISQGTQARPPTSPRPSYLQWKWEEVKALCRLWFRASSCLQAPALLPSGLAEPWMCSTEGNRQGLRRTWSSELQTPHRLWFPMVTACSLVFTGKFGPETTLAPAAPAV